jgi:hypothetical protein
VYCLLLQENPDSRKYSTHLATRPAKFEEDAAHMLIDVLVEEHISSRPDSSLCVLWHCRRTLTRASTPRTLPPGPCTLRVLLL